MKKLISITLALAFLLVLCGYPKSGPGLGPRSSPTTSGSSGNIPDGIYTIVGEGSKRCLEIPNNSCLADVGLQVFDCDATETSNNQKFNVASDGAGNYTIMPAHSDLCLEVASEKFAGRLPVQQSVCSAGNKSQKWSMSQYGDNLEIRDVANNQCLDIMRKGTGNFAPIYLRPCSNGTNQRWRLRKTSLNVDKGVICRASPSHPERNCSGVNNHEKQVQLGKTLTKVRCEDVCKATGMVSCQWEGSQ